MCKNKKGLTPTFSIEVGTRQGCNLSPTLFNLFLNDLPSQFNSDCKPVIINDIKLSCLMYADDLVLISETEKGMHNCLLTLETFCKKWRLTINIEKTKLLIVNQPKKLDFNFRINNCKLEIVDSFSYLGLIISKKCNFQTAINELLKKATRAYYAIKKDFNFINNTHPKIIIKLYESMVQPILLYCSEIWGIFGWKKNEASCIKQYILNSKHKFESLHTMMCKNALGVSKHTSDLMSKSELGRYPIISNIIKNTYTYWQHILHSKSNSLLHQTHAHLSKNVTKHVNFQSRFYALLKVLNSTNLFHICIPTDTKRYSNILKAEYNKLYEQHFFSTINSKGGRFELYSKVKKVYKFESYLNLHKNDLRRHITKIRTSCHSLPIENLRKSKIERDKRYCKLCSDNQIGSEEHTLVHCKNEILNKIRLELFNKIYYYCNQWLDLPDKTKFIYLMSAVDDTCNFYFAIFLDKLYKLIKQKC